MFATQILRSAAALRATKQVASKQVRFTVNPGYVTSILKLYAKKVPVVFQWGFLLSGVLLHSFALKGFVNTFHLNNHAASPYNKSML